MASCVSVSSLFTAESMAGRLCCPTTCTGAVGSWVLDLNGLGCWRCCRFLCPSPHIQAPQPCWDEGTGAHSLGPKVILLKESQRNPGAKKPPKTTRKPQAVLAHPVSAGTRCLPVEAIEVFVPLGLWSWTSSWTALGQPDCRIHDTNEALVISSNPETDGDELDSIPRDTPDLREL